MIQHAEPTYYLCLVARILKINKSSEYCLSIQSIIGLFLIRKNPINNTSLKFICFRIISPYPLLFMNSTHSPLSDIHFK